MNTETNSIWLPQAIVIAMLMAAPFLMDSDVYFGLCKLVCCPVFAYLAYHAWKLKKTVWVWVFGIAAVIYNPIIRVYSIWDMSLLVVLASIGIAFASLFALNSNSQEK